MRLLSILLIANLLACSSKEQKSPSPEPSPKVSEVPATPHQAARDKAHPDVRDTAAPTAPRDEPVADKAAKGAAGDTALATSAASAAGAAPPAQAAAPGHASAPAKKPIKVVPMLGPKKTLKALCAPDDCFVDPPGEDERITGEPTYAIKVARSLAPPFEAARFIVKESDYIFGCRLAVKVAGGWYLQAGEAEECWEMSSRTSLSTDVDEFAVKQFVPGGQPELVLRTKAESFMSNMDNDGATQNSTTHTMTVCGVGTSGKPSCFALDTGGSWETSRDDLNAPNADLAKDLQEGKGTWKQHVGWKDGVMHVTGDAPQQGYGWSDRRGTHGKVIWP